MTHRPSAPPRLQKKIGSVIYILFLHSWSKWKWELRGLKRGYKASAVLLQRAKFACIKPLTSVPTDEQKFAVVMCPLPKSWPSAFEQSCCAPWPAGREGTPVPHDYNTSHCQMAGRVTHQRLCVMLHFASTGSAFAWGGFYGGHVCVQTSTYSNMGWPSWCSHECKLTVKGKSRRRCYSAQASQRDEQPHLLLKSVPQRRAKNFIWRCRESVCFGCREWFPITEG